jgi:hypothetical protein
MKFKSAQPQFATWTELRSVMQMLVPLPKGPIELMLGL